MSLQDRTYKSRRSNIVGFSLKMCATCGDEINPPRGPGKAYTYCAKCCNPGTRGSRARTYKQRRLAEARERGVFGWARRS